MHRGPQPAAANIAIVGALILFAMCLSVLAEEPTAEQKEARQARIDRAIDSGIDFLVREMERKQVDANGPGQVALESYALVVAGVSGEHPVIQKNLEYLKRTGFGSRNTYVLTCCAFLLDALMVQLETDFLITSGGKSKKIPDELTSHWRGKFADVIELVQNGQNTSRLWRYEPNARDFDLSCTQFAVLALGLAAKRGIATPRANWEKLIDAILDFQQKESVLTSKRITLLSAEELAARGDGVTLEPELEDEKGKDGQPRLGKRKTGGGTSVAEQPRPRDPVVGREDIDVRARGVGYHVTDRPTSSWNMSCAALSSLLVADDLMGGELPKEKRDRLAAGIRDNYGWLMEHWTPTQTLYGMYSLEKVGDIGNVKLFDGNDWFAILSDHLVARQEMTGRWKGQGDYGENERVATAFALLILNRATSLLSGNQNPAARVVLTGTSGGEREHSRWVHVPALDTSIYYPQLIRTMALRPSPRLAELLGLVIAELPIDERPELLTELAQGRARTTTPALGKLFSNVIKEITGRAELDAAGLETWQREWRRVRAIARSKRAEDAGELLEIYQNAGDSLPLKRACLAAIVALRWQLAAPALLRDLEHTNVDVRVASFETLNALFTRVPPGFDAHASPEARRVALESLHAWYATEKSAVMVRLGEEHEFEPHLIPYLRDVKRAAGICELGPASRICIEDTALRRVAEAFASDLRRLCGLPLPVALLEGSTPGPANGDIRLALSESSAAESYSIVVADAIELRAREPLAIATGAASLLQLVTNYGGLWGVPRWTIEDAPRLAYRGLSVDIASAPHTLAVLEDLIVLCRFYKIRYLALRLGGDRACAYESKALPALANGTPESFPTFSISQLQELENFARDRGIVLTAEFSLTSQAGALVRAIPSLKIDGAQTRELSHTVNFASERAVKALEPLIQELCELFPAAPHVHLVGVAVDAKSAGKDPDFQRALRASKLGDVAIDDLLRKYIVQLHALVRARGKQLVVSDAFARASHPKIVVPKDVVVLAHGSSDYPPSALVEDGYSIINAADAPLRVTETARWIVDRWLEWKSTRWGKHASRWSDVQWQELAAGADAVGGQLRACELRAAVELESLRTRVPVLADKLWSSVARDDADEFRTRLAATDALLGRLLGVVSFHFDGLTDAIVAEPRVNLFKDAVLVAMRCRTPGAEIRYTLDGSAPTMGSLAYAGPLRIFEKTTVRAIALTPAGEPLGSAYGACFERAGRAVENLATGKPVQCSGGTEKDHAPELAVDGKRELASSWWASPAPQWLIVNLQKTHQLGRIVVFPYWDGNRSYQYLVEVSTNGKTWKVVGDRRNNSAAATEQGDSFELAPPVEARLVRITLLKNSVNAAVHLVELEVHEAK
ncbi:MAG: discoidin domain-containing protein [Planctomycetota bacterium]